MRRYGFGAALLVVLSAAAAGEDAVTVKVARPKAGDRVKVTVEEKATAKYNVTVMGMTQAKDEVKVKSLVYVDEVIEGPKEGRYPTKLKRTYEKARVDAAGKADTLSVEGKTVLIEKAGEKYTFTVDGKPVGGEAEKLLAEEFGKADRKDPEAAMLPAKPIKSGETWKIDGAALQEAMGPTGPTIDPAKVKAEGKLVKVYQKGGRTFGVMEITVDAPVTGLGEKLPIEVKEGKLALALTGDGVIDGSAPTGTSKTVTKLGIAGSGKGLDLKVDADVVETRTQELVPKD